MNNIIRTTIIIAAILLIMYLVTLYLFWKWGRYTESEARE